jgi:hypothetical protein
MASSIPLDKMTTAEKLQAMESLWDDLCRQAGGVPSPAWHGAVLAEREADRRSGAEQPEDWDAAKRRIRNKPR